MKIKAIVQSNFVKQLEERHSWLVLIIIFSFYYLDFVPNGNEETYLQFAKAFFEPDWIKNSFVLTDLSASRLLYQYIIGFFLKLFSFEVVLLIFRGFFIVAYSLVLSKLYKALKINNLMIIVHLVILYLGEQSFFAGSWMFISVEAKAFAYLLVLMALNSVLHRKYELTILLLIAATYFHIFVGFYAFVYIALSILITEKWNFKSNFGLILKLAVYFLAILPYVYYLRSNINVVSDAIPSSDWIYTYFRNPHHTTILNTGLYQIKGIGLSFIALLSLIYLRKKDSEDHKIQVLYVVGIVTLAGTLLLVPFIFFDKNGTFLKFYLFRINAFSTFIFTLILVRWMYKIVKEKYRTIAYLAIGVIASIKLLSIAAYRYSKITSYNDDSYIELCEYIKSDTKNNSIVLSIFNTGELSLGNEDNLLSLTRRIERDRFVVYKFCPSDLNKIHEWYKRIGLKEDIEKDISILEGVSNEYKIDYVLSEKPFDEEFMSLEFSNGTYFFYKNHKAASQKP